jgi:hypothetical protein
VEKGGAQREMENFEVALDGKIVAREPNGDVIQMEEVPGWQVLDFAPLQPILASARCL